MTEQFPLPENSNPTIKAHLQIIRFESEAGTLFDSADSVIDTTDAFTIGNPNSGYVEYDLGDESDEWVRFVE